MEERKLQLRQAKKVSIQQKRKMLRPWRTLGIVFLALSFAITPLTVFGEVFQLTPPAFFAGRVQEDGQSVDAEQLSYTAQAEAVTLLCNNGVLPLAAGAKVSAAGELRAALEAAGLSVNSAENTDAVIVTVDAHTEAAAQKEQLLTAMRMKDEGKTQSIVLLVNADSPALEDIFYKNADAALWIAGADRSGMQAVADVLAGKVNPSGRLPMTCPAQPVLYGGDTSAPQSAAAGYQEYEAQYAAYVEGSQTSDAYAQQVAFAFGFGLGYTEFAYSDMQVSLEGEQLQLTLNVTNTGAVAGKETVQIYMQQPEKPGVSLTGFAKTRLLAAGETEQVTITVDTKTLATYDAGGTEAYVLAAGNYYLTAATDAHQAVNNILAAKDYTPENTQGRMDSAGQRENVCLWTAEETQMFTAAAPVAQDSQMPTMGAENGIILAQMAGVAYDDPLWQTLLDQLDLFQMLNCYLRLPVAAVQAPAIRMEALEKRCPSKTVLAAGWNTQLIKDIGAGLGSSCLQKGITCLQDGLWQTEDTLLLENTRDALYSGLQEKGIGICGDERVSRRRLLRSLLSPAEAEPAFVNTLREICHRNLYRIANSAAMNSADSQLWQPGYFWILRGAMLLSWALFSFFALLWIRGRRRWKRTVEYLNYKTLKATVREEKKPQSETVV